MFRIPGTTAIPSLALSFVLSASSLLAQAPVPPSAANASPTLSTAQAVTLAEQGRCKEAVAGLKHAMTSPGTTESRKNAGVLGLRCSLALDNRDLALDFLHLLGKQFPQDPDILFITVHAYSDLSTRTAQDLGRIAPQSIAARKLFAESFEMQGKWDDAQREYESMIGQDPNAVGIHFLLGRVLLSRPDADANAALRAKQEFQKEIELDPKNAAAHYILGELASKDEKWDEAIAQFSAAAKLDPNFAEAYLGWGFCLVTLKRYEEAIPPLRAAERLTPGNPTVHYSLGTALSRSGQKEEAEKEFAIHRSLTAAKPAPPAPGNPQ